MKRYLKYNIKEVFFIIVTISILSSCAIVRKPYKRPADINSIADSLYRTENNGKDTVSMASLSWKELFKDEKLQQLIDKGIKNSNSLKIAIAKIKAAQANLTQSKQTLLPSISTTASAERQKSASTSTNQNSTTYNTFSLTGTVSWEADIWGKLQSTRDSDLDLLLQSEAYKREVQTQMVASIAEYYYTLSAYDKQLEITKATIKNREEDVKSTQVLYNYNTSTNADVAESKASLQTAILTKISLEQSIEQTENALCTIIGIPSQTIDRNSIIDLPIVDSLQIGLPIQLLANRPDVQEAEYQLRYYANMENVARAYFYPSVSISSSGGWSSNKIKDLINPSSLVWNILGSLTQPLFQQGENKQRLNIAKANVEQYTAAFKQALLDGAQEVNDYLIQYKKGIELEQARDIRIKHLEQALNDSKLLMAHSSSATYLDVLTADSNLLSAQLSIVNDKLQQAEAVINIYRSLGGGWK